MDPVLIILGIAGVLGTVIVIAATLALAELFERRRRPAESPAASPAERFRAGDRVVLLTFSTYLRNYHGATPGTLGNIIGSFHASSPGDPVSTCMVKWDTGADPVRCGLGEIDTVRHLLEMHAHRRAKDEYGEGPDAVSRRVGFEEGVVWLTRLLPQPQLERVASELALVESEGS